MLCRPDLFPFDHKWRVAGALGIAREVYDGFLIAFECCTAPSLVLCL